MAFIGHVATADGLYVDPQNVIMEMPQPDDVATVQRLLVLAVSQEAPASSV